MKFRKRREDHEENYWQPATDIMAGLLLVILLIMALLLLYITQKEKGPDYDHGGAGVASPDSYHSATVPTYYDRDDDSSGGYTVIESGGGSGGENETTVDETTEPTYGMDEYGKTAVFVSVVDAETGNTIKQAGMTFELYTSTENRERGGLKKLNTYYPEKIEYSKYETTKNGTFYLPEKIPSGWYSMHSIKVPEKYDTGDNVDFEITEALDWPEPYMLKIPLSPAKNIIRVQSSDSETSEPVQNCTYEIIAAEDIVTLDGTLRYSKDQSVGTIVCGKDGYGESERLYLGKYRLRQETPGEYYALYPKAINVDVESAATSETPVNTVLCDKTTFSLTLTDEYTGEGIANAVYSVEGGDNLETDVSGTVSMTDLTKDNTYRLTLKSLPEKYKANETELSFTVDKNGYIDGEVHSTLEQTAYITRLTVSVKDILLRNDLNSESLTLFDQSDSPVQTWDTNGSAKTIEGLEPGNYFLEAGGKASTRISVTVHDDSTPAEAYIYIWTGTDFVIILVAVLITALAITITVYIIKRKKVKKSDA